MSISKRNTIKKTSVLVLADFLFPEFLGGSARLASDFNDALEQSGYEVTCITRRPAGNYSSNYKVQRPYRVVYANDFKSVSEIIFSKKWDIVFSHHFALALLTYFINKKTKFCYFFHGPVHLERLSRGGGNVGALLRRAAEYFALLRHKEILCLSDYMKAYVPESLKDKVVVTGALHNSKIENVFISKRLASGSVKLLTVRRLTPRTGVIELCEMVRRLNGAATLTVVGGGELFDSLKSMENTNLIVLGQVSDDELDRLYRQSDLVVLPSLELEGFGLIIVESLIRGTPVLASDRAGGGADFLRSFSSDFIYNLNCDPEDFIKKVRTAIDVYADEDIRSRLHHRINDFHMRTFIDRYLLNQ